MYTNHRIIPPRKKKIKNNVQRYLNKKEFTFPVCIKINTIKCVLHTLNEIV